MPCMKVHPETMCSAVPGLLPPNYIWCCYLSFLQGPTHLISIFENKIPVTEDGRSHNEDKLPSSPKSPLPQLVPAVHHTLPFPFKALPSPPDCKKGEEQQQQQQQKDMAGLSVLLEAQNNLTKYTHIISKTSLMKNASLPSTCTNSSSFSASHFLERCYLCRRRLQQGNDIYMYRGDRAFCSVECRNRQIFMDEENGRRDNCSLDAELQAERGRPRVVARKGRATAGGFAY